MRTQLAVAVALVLCLARAGVARECDTFDDCQAGMCQEGQCVAVPLNGGTCDDFNDCTADDTCVNGECRGTPRAGASCDDGDDCTDGDTCTVLGALDLLCLGAPVADGTPCASNCGFCTDIAQAPKSVCLGDNTMLNQPCTPADADDLGGCFVGRCHIEFPGYASCSLMLKACPDDGNPCTAEFCNSETGQCDTSPLPLRVECFPAQCHRCDPATGQCVPANVGEACDDFNVCTASTACDDSGACVAGAARCVGDCDRNSIVRVNEMLIGVNIALEHAPFSQCPSFDLNGNERVDVSELVSGVNSLVRGCLAVVNTTR